jgi:hypothetical protein
VSRINAASKYRFITHRCALGISFQYSPVLSACVYILFISGERVQWHGVIASRQSHSIKQPDIQRTYECLGMIGVAASWTALLAPSNGQVLAGLDT